MHQREVAEYLVHAFNRKHDCAFDGIVFYSNDRWMVLDRHTGHVGPKATSPIEEHEAFVVFDEARCRYALANTQPCGAVASHCGACVNGTMLRPNTAAQTHARDFAV